ncbi:serine hydrolase [Synechococcus sp. CBW1006]|uniref:serine hydrolase n=1 Tax=Synechococcus sp. CBW1006 TaxID=1353138 RepID=UPI001E596FC7|nr:serine hydrolase [Synechococcus sp. CBW1006]
MDGGLAALRRLGGLLGLVVLVGPLAAAPAAEAQVQAQAQARLVAALARLDTLAADTLRRTGVPGLAVAVVADGEVVVAKGFGRRQVDRPDPVDADTVFQLASLSKPLATTVVAALVGDGPLAWDTPVRRYVPELRLGPPAIADSVTLRDLFSHRSGLPDHAGDDLEDIGFGRIAVIERLRFLPLDNRFRASYAYTNLGFTAAAEAAARSTGRSWEEISAERLYRPLGMDRTSSRHADWLAQPNRAVLHRQQGERWQALPAVVIPQRPQPARPPAAYTGSYANDYVGTAVVRLAGSGVAPGGAAGAGSNLVLELGPARRPFALEHVSGDTFRYQPTGENADGASAVVFAPGPGGRATSVRIDNLNLQGQGTLRRQDP